MDRPRTNLLKASEQHFLAFLVQHIPAWMHSDLLTVIGLAGSMTTMAGFILAHYVHRALLLLGVLGLIINWFGDSLDGRLAYFRNQPRKWYGFSLDYTVDWLGNICIGAGYIVYAAGSWEILGFGFVTLYGWAMMTALLRYKITGKYTIDSGLFGPTEVRIVIALLLTLEVILEGSISWFGAAVCLVLFIVNLLDFSQLLRLANRRDREEQALKTTH
jgi:hypothetical protein